MQFESGTVLRMLCARVNERSGSVHVLHRRTLYCTTGNNSVEAWTIEWSYYKLRTGNNYAYNIKYVPYTYSTLYVCILRCMEWDNTFE